MKPRTRSYAPTASEAGAWAEVLVRRGLLYRAVLAPNGQWLVQHDPESPVHVLAGPAEVVELAAAIQYRIRSKEPRNR
ncbi:hypothetical protein ACGFYZ_32970 [Streptomyces sp. NPDC048330]|uniref:hypothetical protein n=1 Tax=Streptomyces sp. NPDC048330 TaxID=3365533 RepID=UPI003716CFA8